MKQISWFHEKVVRQELTPAVLITVTVKGAYYSSIVYESPSPVSEVGVSDIKIDASENLTSKTEDCCSEQRGFDELHYSDLKER